MTTPVLDRSAAAVAPDARARAAGTQTGNPIGNPAGTPRGPASQAAQPTSSAVGRAGSVRRTPIMPVAAPRISPSTRWFIGSAGVVLVVLLSLFAWRMLSDPVRFPVSNVDVLGTLDYTDRTALQERVALYTDEGFYTLNIDALRNDIESLPWVAEARIAREWPGRVKITIEEHEPAARWNDDGLVSKRLELFKPPQLARDDVRFADWQRIFSTLPELRGSDGRHSAVLDDYRRYSAALVPLGLSVQALNEDNRLSQTVTLSRNVTLRLGYEDQERRLGRFIDVFPRLTEAVAADPVTFDMRYRDGFSVAGARVL